MDTTETSANKCIICSKVEGTTPLTLKSFRKSLEKVKKYANQREQYIQSVYHSGCYKNIVNNEKLKRAEKRFRESSSSSKSVVPPKKGRPSRSDSPSCSREVTGERLRRSVGASQHIKTGVFQCSHPSIGELHRVESESMGIRFLLIKSRTKDENVRVALANVNEPSDCAAFELMYHRNCLREHERKLQQSISNWDMQSKSNIGKYIADVDILIAVKCSLASGSTLTMNEINEEYVSILTENEVDSGSSHHKKHLKSIIHENIEDVKFVKSHRSNESDNVVGEKLLRVAVNNLQEQQNEENYIKCIAKTAAILRNELKRHTC